MNLDAGSNYNIIQDSYKKVRVWHMLCSIHKIIKKNLSINDNNKGEM